MVDIDALIRSVKKHEPLWNIHNAAYKSKRRRAILWRQVSAELKTDEASCRKKWKSLRDGFVREDIREVDGSDDGFHSWKYYDQLIFLKNQRIPRKHLRCDAPQSREKSTVINTCNQENSFHEGKLQHKEESNNDEDANAQNGNTANIMEMFQDVKRMDIEEEQFQLEMNNSDPLGSVENVEDVPVNTYRQIAQPQHIQYKAAAHTEANDDGTDEDALFMQSILMKMKKMPLVEKNSLKLNILQMAIEIEEKVLANTR